jgi:2-polyprenyl-3-methyl-5-hydroxy-6-metoxy-1,4-benzoquinol methylase
MVYYPFIEVDIQNENSPQTQQILLVGSNKKVLEIGPATGYVTKELQKRGCRVTCIESNQKMALIAKKFCEEMIIENVEQMNLSMILGKKKFDVILLGEILEHLIEPEKVLKKLTKFLKTSGYVVATIPNIAHGSVRLSLLMGKFEYVSSGLLDRTHLRFFTKRSMEKMFRNAGLEIIKVKSIKNDIFSVPNIKLRQEFPEVLIYSLRKDPEAEIYEFIVKAKPIQGKLSSITRKPEINPIDILRENIVKDEIMESELKKRRLKITKLQQENMKLKKEIKLIRSSFTWMVLSKFSYLVNELMPLGTKRRKYFDLWINRLK